MLKRRELHWSEELKDSSVEEIIRLRTKYKKLGWGNFHIGVETLGKWGDEGHQLLFCMSRMETDDEFNLRVQESDKRKAAREARKNLQPQQTQCETQPLP